MASWYVYSGAAGTGSGADWANAKTTLAAAITAGVAGDTYYIANDHAESSGSVTSISAKGTITAPDLFLCVNRAGSVPPVAADLTTGASITTTGATQLTFSANAYSYVYGVTFNCGTGSSTATVTFGGGTGQVTFDTCSFITPITGAGQRIGVGANANGYTEFINPQFGFGNTGQSLTPTGQVVIRNRPGSSIINGATIPTALFVSYAAFGSMRMDGLDLSSFGSGKTLWPAHGVAALCSIVNCKLGASVTVSGVHTHPDALTDLIGSNSTAIVERNERYLYAGTLTTELTVIRTAGASDGTTAYSWKVATTANAKRLTPFKTFEGVLWNAALGSPLTLTAHVLTDNVTLTDAEIWIEAEYLGTSGTPVATLISDGAATILTPGTNQADDSGTAWTTTGIGTPVKQKLEVTFTPQMAGLVRWRVMIAKASTTVYVDPKPDLA